jgi:hypothetical protein
MGIKRLEQNFVGLQYEYNSLVRNWRTRGKFRNVNDMESCRGSRVISPPILQLCTGRR